jgi:hypothetical protein
LIHATTERSNSTYVSFAVARLEALDANGNTLGWASGFFVDEKDFPSLYTCWHFVVGADPHSLPSKAPPKRTKIRVHTKGIEKESPTITKIGGLNTFDFELYDANDKPIWKQEKPQIGAETAELPVPVVDCVRFDISGSRGTVPGAFKPQDDILNYLDISEDAFIVGYPYGYSAFDDSPDPIFLRRTRASMWAPHSTILLDGPGAKGMSGGPVVTRIENEWRLAGIYTGVVFPEATHFERVLSKNKGISQLPLGKFTMSVIARSVAGVSAEDMGLTSTTGK